MKVIASRTNIRKPIILESLKEEDYYTTKQIKQILIDKHHKHPITNTKTYLGGIDELIRLCTLIDSYRIVNRRKVYIRKEDLKRFLNYYKYLKNNRKPIELIRVDGTELRTVHNISRRTNTPKWKIYRLIHRSKIKVLDFKLNKKYLIPHSEAKKLINVKLFRDELDKLPKQSKKRFTVKEYCKVLSYKKKQFIKYFKNNIESVKKN